MSESNPTTPQNQENEYAIFKSIGDLFVWFYDVIMGTVKLDEYDKVVYGEEAVEGVEKSNILENITENIEDAVKTNNVEKFCANIMQIHHVMHNPAIKNALSTIEQKELKDKIEKLISDNSNSRGLKAAFASIGLTIGVHHLLAFIYTLSTLNFPFIAGFINVFVRTVISEQIISAIFGPESSENNYGLELIRKSMNERMEENKDCLDRLTNYRIPKQKKTFESNNNNKEIVELNNTIEFAKKATFQLYMTGKITTKSLEYFVECLDKEISYFNKIKRIMLNFVDNVADKAGIKFYLPIYEKYIGYKIDESKEAIMANLKENELGINNFKDSLLNIRKLEKLAVNLYNSNKKEVNESECKNLLKQMLEYQGVDINTNKVVWDNNIKLAVNSIKNLAKKYHNDHIITKIGEQTTIPKKYKKLLVSYIVISSILSVLLLPLAPIIMMPNIILIAVQVLSTSLKMISEKVIEPAYQRQFIKNNIKTTVAVFAKIDSESFDLANAKKSIKDYVLSVKLYKKDYEFNNEYNEAKNNFTKKLNKELQHKETFADLLVEQKIKDLFSEVRLNKIEDKNDFKQYYIELNEVLTEKVIEDHKNNKFEYIKDAFNSLFSIINLISLVFFGTHIANYVGIIDNDRLDKKIENVTSALFAFDTSKAESYKNLYEHQQKVKEYKNSNRERG